MTKEKTFNLIELTRKECEAVEEMLCNMNICPTWSFSVMNRFNGSCLFCNKIFPQKYPWRGETHPCWDFGEDYVFDVLLTLLEYNNYELRHAPEAYLGNTRNVRIV